MSKKFTKSAHGIDLFAPGGLTQLFALHRATFGDAVMEAGDGGDGSGAGAGDPAGSAPPAAPPAGDPAGGGADQFQSEGGPRALQAERDARKAADKRAADFEARVKELEDATKSTDEKERERVANLEKSDREKDVQIAERDAKLLRYEIAAAKGLDLKAALRLQGSTREEIEADADEFAKSFASSAPGEVPGAGARGETRVQTTPGIGTLTQGYAETSK
ncbi:hypothetical protein [Arthrobacter sp. C152]